MGKPCLTGVAPLLPLSRCTVRRLWRFSRGGVKRSARAWCPCCLALCLFSLVGTGGCKPRGWGGVLARSKECDARTGRRRTSAVSPSVQRQERKRPVTRKVRRYGGEIKANFAVANWDKRTSSTEALFYSVLFYCAMSCFITII